MHFIFDLIRKILTAKHGSDEVVLWGDGHHRRERMRRYTGARTKLLEVGRLRRLLPGAQFTSLEDGLRQTIAWMEPGARAARR